MERFEISKCIFLNCKPLLPFLHYPLYKYFMCVYDPVRQNQSYSCINFQQIFSFLNCITIFLDIRSILFRCAENPKEFNKASRNYIAPSDHLIYVYLSALRPILSDWVAYRKWPRVINILWMEKYLYICNHGNYCICTRNTLIKQQHRPRKSNGYYNNLYIETRMSE